MIIHRNARIALSMLGTVAAGSATSGCANEALSNPTKPSDCTIIDTPSAIVRVRQQACLNTLGLKTQAKEITALKQERAQMKTCLLQYVEAVQRAQGDQASNTAAPASALTKCLDGE